VKRLFGILLLVATAIGVSYGLVVTQKESAYRRFIEDGDAALARDDSYAAIEAFSVAISLKSDSMAAHLKRGEAYRRRGEYEAAKRDLRRAADIDPLAIHPRELLGDVHYNVGLAEGRWAPISFAKAVERYAESVALDDRSARLQYKLGLASYRAGQTAKAIDAVREAIRLEPRFAEAYYVLGLCQRSGGQPYEAIRSLERAVALAPALLPVREELADLYEQLRRYEARLSHLEALAALQPSAARERALAMGYASAGNLDRAVGQLARGAQRYPEDREMFLTLGRLWLQRASTGGRVERSKAIEALQTAAAGDASSEALMLLGRARLLAGDTARAERMLQQATQRFPVATPAFLYLADASERRGHTATAARALVDYAALVPSSSMDAPLLVRVADAYLQVGNRDAARRTVHEALDKSPANQAALDLKARIN
jgi:tetratricopeptide (TPR) repeat protein